MKPDIKKASKKPSKKTANKNGITKNSKNSKKPVVWEYRAPDPFSTDDFWPKPTEEFNEEFMELAMAIDATIDDIDEDSVCIGVSEVEVLRVPTFAMVMWKGHNFVHMQINIRGGMARYQDEIREHAFEINIMENGKRLGRRWVYAVEVGDFISHVHKEYEKVLETLDFEDALNGEPEAEGDIDPQKRPSMKCHSVMNKILTRKWGNWQPSIFVLAFKGFDEQFESHCRSVKDKHDNYAVSGAKAVIREGAKQLAKDRAREREIENKQIEEGIKHAQEARNALEEHQREQKERREERRRRTLAEISINTVEMIVIDGSYNLRQ